jgi:hypothetical protein
MLCDYIRWHIGRRRELGFKGGEEGRDIGCEPLLVVSNDSSRNVCLQPFGFAGREFSHGIAMGGKVCGTGGNTKGIALCNSGLICSYRSVQTGSNMYPGPDL